MENEFFVFLFTFKIYLFIGFNIGGCCPLKVSTGTQVTRVKSLCLLSSSSLRLRASLHLMRFGTLEDPWDQHCLFNSASIRTSWVPISFNAKLLIALMALAARNLRPCP